MKRTGPTADGTRDAEQPPGRREQEVPGAKRPRVETDGTPDAQPPLAEGRRRHPSPGQHPASRHTAAVRNAIQTPLTAVLDGIGKVLRT
ncbi:hypothetical protein AB0885_43380, partial [Streptomyces sp. NPDC005534]